MEEPVAAQYAIQIAVNTLKDRCRTLQQRIAELEEENVNLRITCIQREHDNQSLTEIDKLRQQVAEISEQKCQLQNTIDMVTNENKDLWRKLGKLTKVNRTLGSQLNKINDTLSNHTSTTLIRSKTFTQPEPHTKVLQRNLEENDRISLELENISLKLIDSFSREKQELEVLCSEIKDLQIVDNIVAEDFAFYYDNDIDSDIFNEFYGVLEELKVLKEESLQQQTMLKCCIQKLKDQNEKAQQKNDGMDKSTSTDEYSLDPQPDLKTEPAEQIIISVPIGESDKICPVCTKTYYKNNRFEEFQQHVEDHFTGDDYDVVNLS